MGSFDGAVACELSGIFIISLITTSDYKEMTDWQFLKIQSVAV